MEKGPDVQKIVNDLLHKLHRQNAAVQNTEDHIAILEGKLEVTIEQPKK